MPTALPDMTLNTSTISWLLARLARPAQWSLDIWLLDIYVDIYLPMQRKDTRKSTAEMMMVWRLPRVRSSSPDSRLPTWTPHSV